MVVQHPVPAHHLVQVGAHYEQQQALRGASGARKGKVLFLGGACKGACKQQSPLQGGRWGREGWEAQVGYGLHGGCQQQHPQEKVTHARVRPACPVPPTPYLPTPDPALPTPDPTHNPSPSA